MPESRTSGRTTWLVAAAAGLAVAIVAAELYARFGIGLGDPALMIADPEIEYLYQPSQEGARFGYSYFYNRYSMRSEDFPKEKTDPDELRVLILSDSIMHGGSWVDQADIAPVRLDERLERELERPVIVANASTGSWGPMNQLAYVRRYGLFDADVIVLLMNSLDLDDVPFIGARLDAPSWKPLGALDEGVRWYLWNRVRKQLEDFGLLEPQTGTPPPGDGSFAEKSMGAFAELLRICRESGAPVVVAQYLKESECSEGPMEGHAAVARVARAAGIPTIQLGPLFCRALEEGRQPYLDGLHANVLGHEIMADALAAAVLQRLPGRS